MESSRFRRDDVDSELNLSEWTTNKARISRHNTMSRRFFRQDSISFRSNFTVSSTASSPGYAFKDEIDPSSYCFTTALKALQAKSGYHTWECSSPEGLALNSKWNEAEKYICNPLSGKVPVECLSAKSLSARSFRNNSNRITMSAPLVFSNSTSLKPLSSSSSSTTQQHPTMQFPIPEKKKEGRTRDVGTQSTPPYLSSSSPSPASTPSIMDRSIKRVGESSSPVSNSKTKSEEDDEVEEEEEKVKETEETTKTVTTTTQKEKQQQQGGCFSWTWMTTRFLRNHKTTKPRKYYNNNVFPTHHFKSC